MKRIKKIAVNVLKAIVISTASQAAMATCDEIIAAYTPVAPVVFAVVGAPDNGGYGLPMWVAAVDETGKVCGIINTGGSGAAIGNKSWLGSRVISIQKATTANAFSLDIFSISTANLYGLTQPGGSLFGLEHSNPVDASIVYLGSPDTYGTGLDPLVGKRVGGINVFGGGLGLYNSQGIKVGAIGVSGDTSCTDHAVAWKIRHVLGMDHVPGGFVSGYTPVPSFAVLGDEMIIGSGNVANTYKQVSCAHNKINNPTPGAETGVIIELPV
ncbi:MAG: heme-binding protein [Methylococcales bacterium]|nr:heme-binding protein [Methylococcales bacterium]